MTRAHAAAVAAALALAGCIPEEGPMMDPGEDCLACHGDGTGEESGPTWSVAGTISEGEGTRITVFDANGRSVTMRANQAGNFYTAESLAKPLGAIWVDGKDVAASVDEMQNLPHGSCNRPTAGNSCHAGGRNGD